jgi:hypothetical protein
MLAMLFLQNQALRPKRPEVRELRLVSRQLADRLDFVDDVANPELPTESPANHTGSRD